LSQKNFSKRFPLTKEKPILVTTAKNFVDIKSLVKKLGAYFYECYSLSFVGEGIKRAYQWTIETIFSQGNELENP
jgi:hypothetical protein